MTEDSVKEFLMTSNGEGNFGLPSPRSHITGASLAPVATTSRVKDILDIIATH
jgi:hypothetical protein